MFSVASKYSEIHPYVEMVHSGNSSADIKLCFETYAHLRVNPSISGFSGLEVACWPLVPNFAGSHEVENVGFLGRKNPQHAFLRRGSKAVGPMS